MMLMISIILAILAFTPDGEVEPLEGMVIQKSVGPHGATILYVEAQNGDIVMVSGHQYSTYEIGDHFIGTVAK